MAHASLPRGHILSRPLGHVLLDTSPRTHPLTRPLGHIPLDASFWTRPLGHVLLRLACHSASRGRFTLIDYSLIDSDFTLCLGIRLVPPHIPTPPHVLPRVSPFGGIDETSLICCGLCVECSSHSDGPSSYLSGASRRGIHTLIHTYLFGFGRTDSVFGEEFDRLLSLNFHVAPLVLPPHHLIIGGSPPRF